MYVADKETQKKSYASQSHPMKALRGAKMMLEHVYQHHNGFEAYQQGMLASADCLA